MEVSKSSKINWQSMLLILIVQLCFPEKLTKYAQHFNWSVLLERLSNLVPRLQFHTIRICTKLTKFTSFHQVLNNLLCLHLVSTFAMLDSLTWTTTTNWRQALCLLPSRYLIKNAGNARMRQGSTGTRAHFLHFHFQQLTVGIMQIPTC